MAKRRSTNNEWEETSLGVSEFASILNGTNPHSILRALRWFVKVVRRERQIALANKVENEKEDDGGENGGDSDDSDDDEVVADEESQPTKRFRKDEGWKEDTANFAVPFVGTSFSKKNSATVAIGHWPTGFMQTYLEKSPLAIELTSDHLVSGESLLHKSLIRRKLGRTSQAIQKAYLKALAELVTAVIPIAKLTVDDCSQPSNVGSASRTRHPIVTELLKRRLAGLINFIREETGNGKGKSGCPGGCGILAIHAVRVITRLVMVDASVARHAVRSIEQGISEAVIRFVFKHKEASNDESFVKLCMRTVALDLVTSFIHSNDALVLSSICSSGMRDRKIPAGLLYWACKEGISGLAEDFRPATKKWGRAMVSAQRLLNAIRKRLTDTGSSKAFTGIFSRDTIRNISQLAVRAPALPSYDSEHTCVEPHLHLFIEAKRMLFLLITSPRHSPLLQSVTERGREVSSHYAQQHLVYAMIQMLEGSKSLMETHKLLLSAVSVTPSLLPILFKNLTMPDITKSFLVISRLNLICLLVQKGPSVLQCLHGFLSADPVATAEYASTAILPVSLNSQYVKRALQSSNKLVVSEMLRVIILSVDRMKQYLDESHLLNSKKTELLRLVPDLRTVISVIVRHGDLTNKANAIILHRACRAILSIGKTLPESLTDFTFDWSKIFSEENLFLRAPLFIQHDILYCVKDIIGLNELFISPSNQAKLCVEVLKVVRRTSSYLIYTQGRMLALVLLGRLQLHYRCYSPQLMSSVDYELSCWVDGSNELVDDELTTILGQSSRSSLNTLIEFTSIWTSTKLEGPVPLVQTSRLLFDALLTLEKASLPLTLLTCQVALKCLMYQSDSLSLAVLVRDACSKALDSLQNGPKLKAMSAINDLAASRVQHGKFLKGSLTHALRTLLPDQLRQLHQPTSLYPESRFRPSMMVMDAYSFAYLLLNLLDSADVEGDRDVYIPALRRIVPMVVLHSGFPMLKRTVNLFDSGTNYILDVIDATSTGYRKSIPSNKLGSLNSPRDWMRTTHGSDRLFGVLFINVVSPFVTSKIALEYIRILLSEKFVTHNLFLRPVLMPLLSRSFRCLSDEQRDPSLCYETSCALVNGWISVCKDFAFANVDETLELMESVISRLLQDKSSLSTIMQIALSRLCTEDLITLALKRGITSGKSILFSIVQSNLMRYRHEFLKQVKPFIAGGDTGFARSAIDDSISVVAVSDCNSLEEKELLHEWQVDFFKHAASILSKPAELLDVDQTSFTVLIRLLRSDKIAVAQIVSLSKPMTGLLAYLVNVLDRESFASRILDIIIECSIVMFGHCVNEETSSASELGSKLLALLSRFVSKLLKNCAQEDLSVGCDDSIAANLLGWIIRTLDQSYGKVEYSFDDADTKAVSSLIRTCLRHGLNKGNALRETTRHDCLGAVQGILENLTGISPTLHSDVFNMVVSHSQFYAILTDSSSARLRHSTITLLISCLSRVRTLSFDRELWTALLENFRAGVEEYDLALRRFLFSYLKITVRPSNSYLHHLLEGELLLTKSQDHQCSVSLDQFRWLGVPNHGLKSSGWDWLIDALDLSRVHATLRWFPIDDSVDPHSIGPDARMLMRFSKEISGDFDQRYSPGFLLPLILGAIEATLTLPQGDWSHSTVNESISIDAGQVPNIQRLCEKGGLALSLMALCSNCAGVRRYSASILGLLSLILRSNHAVALASWRERPQLVMLVDSVQRALALTPHEKHGVAQLPPVSSLFLARASLILQRPGDRLFPSVNRTFLRIETNYGAFQDIWRIPLFVSLLCSSADDPEQVASERAWVLSLVRDGFLNESCYKPLLSCHGVELLFTYFDNIRLRPTHDKFAECTLLLSIMEVVLSRGGERCEHHLIYRLGLLPFLRSCLLGRPVLDTLRTSKSRCSFLRLLSTSLVKGKARLDSVNLALVTKGLPQGIINFSITTLRNCLDPGITVNIVTHTISAFEILASTVGMNASNKGFETIETCAIRLADANEFLALVEVPNFFHISAICSLPIQSSACEYRAAGEFLRRVLAVGETNKLGQLPWHTVWSCVADGARILKSSDVPTIVSLVMKLRYAAVENGSLDAWLACLHSLTDSDTSNNEWMQLARILIHEAK